MDKEKYKFYSHRECEFFPCHEGVDPANFNCLFCYCPLYALGTECGGKYIILDNGVKDCSECKIPHGKKAYEYIIGKFGEIIEITKKNINEK